ncbi:serine hydrolase [Dyella acidiphila]|uniref:Class A beta-lactamase-related serine hydrolase n=1 Tax=Dyella acidiphila TaxID=2775866 RepID=A0ABR9GA21_9GAMM|nr:serine hydrolase [Dyella acidiphila]MBE1160901.1 class A beta-lactamase-related serine hydrolase [Dyella acidiphila]
MPHRRKIALATLLLTLCAGTSQAAPPATPLTLQSVVLTLPAETGKPPLTFTLGDLMRIYKVPGVSIAYVENNQLAWAKGYGITAPGSTAPVTTGTLFQAASISKPVTAAGGLWLVEHGKLNLDSDVNQTLKSWKVPENTYTAKAKVTLRGLMSHNAGLNVHGFAGYAQGTPIPTTEQTLDGVAPANNPPIRVTTVPGTECIYSGGGVTIEGLLIKEASGQRFEDFMREHVLLPAGMTSSSFDQNLPPALAARAASGTHADGTMVPGKWHIYPELAPDGLWTTPSDLARFGIEIAKSREGQANHILSTAMTREMLKPQCHDTPGDAGGVGLGFGVGYHGYPGQFRHNGANDGFESYLFMDADRGWGVALMGNSDAFQSIYPYVAETLAQAHGWPYPSKGMPLSDKLTLIGAKFGVQAALASYEQARKSGVEEANSSVPLNALGYQLLGDGKTDDAIRVLQRNTVLFAKDGNTYDSLGEAYAKAGKKDLAIRNYQKSLELDPKNDNARVQLKKLGN